MSDDAPECWDPCPLCRPLTYLGAPRDQQTLQRFLEKQFNWPWRVCHECHGVGELAHEAPCGECDGEGNVSIEDTTACPFCYGTDIVPPHRIVEAVFMYEASKVG